MTVEFSNPASILVITGFAPSPDFCITIGFAAVPVAVNKMGEEVFSVWPAATFAVTPPGPTPTKFTSVTNAAMLA